MSRLAFLGDLRALVLGVVLLGGMVLGCAQNVSPTSTPVPSPTPVPTPRPADCPDTIQGRIDATAAGSVLRLPGCVYTTGATVRKPITIVGGILSLSGGTRGLLVVSNGVTIDGLHVYGAQATTFDEREAGIYVQGTASAPIRNLVVRNTELSTLGYGGLLLRHLDGFVIENNLVHDGVYAGIMVISGSNGRIANNTVRRIGVYGAAANANNAYGIALSRGVGDLTTDPRSADVVVSRNTVEDVPTWHAFDTHGGERITWINNTVRRSRSGIFITGSRSPSGTVRALNNDVNGNTIYGWSGGYYAITSVFSTGGYIRNNTIAGWPTDHAITTTSGSDPAATAVNLTISNNTITP